MTETEMLGFKTQSNFKDPKKKTKPCQQDQFNTHEDTAPCYSLMEEMASERLSDILGHSGLNLFFLFMWAHMYAAIYATSSNFYMLLCLQHCSKPFAPSTIPTGHFSLKFQVNLPFGRKFPTVLAKV